MILCMRSCNTAPTSDVNGRLASSDANQARGRDLASPAAESDDILYIALP
jgi:hypothetical protein